MSPSRVTVLAAIAALVVVGSAFAVGKATKSDASDTDGGLESIEIEADAAPASKADLQPAAPLPSLKVQETSERTRQTEPEPEPGRPADTTPNPAPANPAPANPAPSSPAPSSPRPPASGTPEPFE